MPGMAQAAAAVFELPVRLGFPLKVSGLTDLVNHPMYATGVGLALYGGDRLLRMASAQTARLGFGRGFRRMAIWLRDLL